MSFSYRHSWKKSRNRLFTFDCREWFKEIVITELIHIYCIFLKDGLNIFHIP